MNLIREHQHVCFGSFDLKRVLACDVNMLMTFTRKCKEVPVVHVTASWWRAPCRPGGK